MQTFFSVFSNFKLTDAVDILLVSMAFFLLLTVFRQGRSPVALRGLVFLVLLGFALYLAAVSFNLSATVKLLESFWIVGVLIFLICFQTELKKALSDFGRNPLFRSLFAGRTTAIDDIIVAATRLAEKKIGALICIQRRDPLQTYVDTGTEVDAGVSPELLRTIFAPYTPLHDGAVIIRENRVSAAGCLLPLSESQAIPKDLGTRHRAALGLTEETDAVVIVCSEETGIISLVTDGKLERGESAESLRAKLRQLLEVKEEPEDGEAAR